MKNTIRESVIEAQEKKTYIPPILEVIFVELESGIAASSVFVSPTSVDGNTDQIQTDWAGSDNQIIEVPF
ncbi:hypothetical protein CMU89_18800 [Elizabethkingia anophelis]|uniref:hypothetical protein n=1 Tax=Elizabethkingia anophelis TaxID=1117645 RepID=UPI00099509FC|nr:hypothetical protein [Elizabethkingia anophelis]AQW94709.1 hypothetical protein BBD30_11200 [Elizabethkingia anophelis]MCL1691987.1 hypothetical protein [Elizabethkingia anophelis]MDV3509076.1 hypothetical protein [Elizabethkingia anophelis]MDV3544675.1 hypothetical protein [Elizabethkingia anophelis]MDV3954216.1 hypothetical protein [Elizabethkingia anophelis]